MFALGSFLGLLRGSVWPNCKGKVNSSLQAAIVCTEMAVSHFPWQEQAGGTESCSYNWA